MGLLKFMSYACKHLPRQRLCTLEELLLLHARPALLRSLPV